MNKRKWICRIIGALLVLLGLYLLVIGYEYTLIISAATIVLIIGVAVWMMATPESYNSVNSDVLMISMDRPRKIEEFYEAYKQVETPLGSAWLGKFYTMKQKALVFGPNDQGEYLYFWLTRNGKTGYLGYSQMDSFIKKQITQPLIPMKEVNKSLFNDHYDLELFQRELKDNLKLFVKNGRVFPFSRVQNSGRTDSKESRQDQQ